MLLLLLLTGLMLGRGAYGLAPTEGYRVVHAYPHDRSAFTQGLVMIDGMLYEGTGLKGRSSVRAVDLATGRVLQSVKVPDKYFGEGLTDWGGNLIELTWLAHLRLRPIQYARGQDVQVQGRGLGADAR